MIDAYRRGYQSGSEASHKDPQLRLLSEEAVSDIAHRVFAGMMKQGFAHIEPKSDFIVGFVEGVQISFLHQNFCSASVVSRRLTM